MELFAPAYGPLLAQKISQTQIYTQTLQTDPELIARLSDEHAFGHFHRLMIGAGDDGAVHPEIRAVVEHMIQEFVSSGIYTHYLNHGYSTTRLSAKIEYPQEFAQAQRIVHRVTKRLAQFVGPANVWIGVGPIGEGFGRNDVSTEHYLSTKDHDWYVAYRREYLTSVIGVGKNASPVAGVVMETAYNSRSMQALIDVCQEYDLAVLLSWYVNKDGLIPDLCVDSGGGVRIEQMCELLLNHSSRWVGGMSCVSRSVARTCLDRVSDAGYADRVVALWTNSSPECYIGAYDATYEQSLPDFILEVSSVYPHVQYMTGCCGHTHADLLSIKF